MARQPTQTERSLWQRFTHDVALSEQSALYNPHANAGFEFAQSMQVQGVSSNMKTQGSQAEETANKLADASLQSIYQRWVEDSATTTHKAPAKMEFLQEDELHQVNRRHATKLRRGQLVTQATLDLHGMHQEAAYGHFQQFIAQALQQNLRVVMVITGYGKMTGGKGVLRGLLPQWLNYPEHRCHILGFRHAPQNQGGKGAFLILLKQRKTKQSSVS